MLTTDLNDNTPLLSDLKFRALARPEKRRYLRFIATNRRWRLNNLYKIEDEQGRVVTFEMRDAQRELFESSHTFEIILKARQLGFSTYIDIYGLDCCLFSKKLQSGDYRAGLRKRGCYLRN